MGFGDTQRRLTESQSNTAKKSTDGEKKVFVSPVLDTKPGLRIIRLLPAYPLQQVPVGNQFYYAMEAEVAFADYWIFVNDEKHREGRRKQRVFVDPFNRFDNYIWKNVLEPLAKDNAERKLCKLQFAVNVFDRTPVIKMDDGAIIYPDQAGDYWYGFGKERKKLDPSLKTPRNQIVILEGSNGPDGGKHLFGKLTTQIKNTTIEDENGTDIIAPAYSYDLRLSSTIPQGKEAKDVERAFIGGQMKPLPNEDVVWSMPRYQLADFYKPYPEEALIELVEGVDVSEVMEKYNIPRWVRLPEVADEETPF